MSGRRCKALIASFVAAASVGALSASQAAAESSSVDAYAGQALVLGKPSARPHRTGTRPGSRSRPPGASETEASSAAGSSGSGSSSGPGSGSSSGTGGSGSGASAPGASGTAASSPVRGSSSSSPSTGSASPEGSARAGRVSSAPGTSTSATAEQTQQPCPCGRGTRRQGGVRQARDRIRERPATELSRRAADHRRTALPARHSAVHTPSCRDTQLAPTIPGRSTPAVKAGCLEPWRSSPFIA